MQKCHSSDVNHIQETLTQLATMPPAHLPGGGSIVISHFENAFIPQWIEKVTQGWLQINYHLHQNNRPYKTIRSRDNVISGLSLNCCQTFQQPSVSLQPSWNPNLNDKPLIETLFTRVIFYQPIATRLPSAGFGTCDDYMHIQYTELSAMIVVYFFCNITHTDFMENKSIIKLF